MTFSVNEQHTKRVVVEVPESVRIDAAFFAKDFVKGTSRYGPAYTDLQNHGDCTVYVTEAGRVGVRCLGLSGFGADGLMSVEFDPRDLVAMAEWIREAGIIDG